MQKTLQPKDVVLYGFGRIGRLLARELMSNRKRVSTALKSSSYQRAIMKTVLEKRASLLRIDSVHGDFLGTVQNRYRKQRINY